MDFVQVAMVAQVTAAKSPSGWEVASTIGTVGATLVALALGLYQWFKDIRRQHDVRAALARALSTDLDTWREVVEDHRRTFDEKKLASEDDYVVWVDALKRPTMPAHERFYMMLPDLGRVISRKVVHAYAEAMRVGELIEWETHKRGIKDRDHVRIATDIRPHLDALTIDLREAADALRPFAQ